QRPPSKNRRAEESGLKGSRRTEGRGGGTEAGGRRGLRLGLGLRLGPAVQGTARRPPLLNPDPSLNPLLPSFSVLCRLSGPRASAGLAPPPSGRARRARARRGTG